MNTTDALLKGILATVGCKAFPPNALSKIVAPTKGSERQMLAYNLCDGETPQAEVAEKAKMDRGNLSRLIGKWIEAGIIIRVGADGHPLHLYPLTKPAKSSNKAA